MSWAERARGAAIALMTGEERQDDSVTATLLRDIHGIFSSPEITSRLKTSDLLAFLHEIEESPWGDWYGKRLSAHGLSGLLKAYRIKTMPVKAEGRTVRGYKVEQFADAFAQLGLQSVTSVTSVTPEARSQAGGNASNASNASGREQRENGAPLIGEDGYGAYLKNALDRGVMKVEDAKRALVAHECLREGRRVS